MQRVSPSSHLVLTKPKRFGYLRLRGTGLAVSVWLDYTLARSEIVL
jgi:hypothetical protein